MIFKLQSLQILPFHRHLQTFLPKEQFVQHLHQGTNWQHQKLVGLNFQLIQHCRLHRQDIVEHFLY